MIAGPLHPASAAAKRRSRASDTSPRRAPRGARPVPSRAARDRVRLGVLARVGSGANHPAGPKVAYCAVATREDVEGWNARSGPLFTTEQRSSVGGEHAWWSCSSRRHQSSSSGSMPIYLDVAPWREAIAAIVQAVEHDRECAATSGAEGQVANGAGCPKDRQRRASGTLPLFSRSFCMTCWCSHVFIAALSLASPW